MKNKKVIASFKCVLAMLSCLMLGACRPQMAKAAFKTAERVMSRGGYSKAEQAAARFAAKGVVNPHFSGGDFVRARNIPGSSGVMSQDAWGNAGRVIYNVSRQHRGYDESDQENQSYYYR